MHHAVHHAVIMTSVMTHISLRVAHSMRRCRKSARRLNPEDANCGKAAANLAYIRREFGAESGILSGVEERSPLGSLRSIPTTAIGCA